MTFSVSDTVGPYRILEELGRGGMGRVFKVEHNLTQRIEAMKVLERGRPEAPGQAERSLREIRVQARLEHDHIARPAPEHLVGESLPVPNGITHLDIPHGGQSYRNTKEPATPSTEALRRRDETPQAAPDARAGAVGPSGIPSTESSRS